MCDNQHVFGSLCILGVVMNLLLGRVLGSACAVVIGLGFQFVLIIGRVVGFVLGHAPALDLVTLGIIRCHTWH